MYLNNNVDIWRPGLDPFSMPGHRVEEALMSHLNCVFGHSLFGSENTGGKSSYSSWLPGSLWEYTPSPSPSFDCDCVCDYACACTVLLLLLLLLPAYESIYVRPNEAIALKRSLWKCATDHQTRSLFLETVSLTLLPSLLPFLPLGWAYLSLGSVCLVYTLTHVCLLYGPFQNGVQSGEVRLP